MEICQGYPRNFQWQLGIASRGKMKDKTYNNRNDPSTSLSSKPSHLHHFRFKEGRPQRKRKITQNTPQSSSSETIQTFALLPCQAEMSRESAITLEPVASKSRSFNKTLDKVADHDWDVTTHSIPEADSPQLLNTLVRESLPCSGVGHSLSWNFGETFDFPEASLSSEAPIWSIFDEIDELPALESPDRTHIDSSLMGNTKPLISYPPASQIDGLLNMCMIPKILFKSGFELILFKMIPNCVILR